MADDRKGETLRNAATEAMKAGEDVTRRFRDLTLDALRTGASTARPSATWCAP